MTIVRKPELFNSLLNLSDLLEHNRFNGNASQSNFIPAVNIKETKDSYELYMAVPGMKKEDFKIELEGDTLAISSDKKMEIDDSDDVRYSKIEFRYAPFKRVFNLTENTINSENIKASYENGVLLLVLPKREEVKPLIKQIEIA